MFQPVRTVCVWHTTFSFLCSSHSTLSCLILQLCCSLTEYCRNAVHLLHSVCFPVQGERRLFPDVVCLCCVFWSVVVLAQVSINVRVSLDSVPEIRAARQCALQTFS